MTKKRAIIVGAVGAVAIILILVGIFFGRTIIHSLTPPSTDISVYQGSAFSFSYPRFDELQEFDTNSVLVGTVDKKKEFVPLVQVMRYHNDPDAPLPASYEAYVKKQAQYLCGSDGSVENVFCNDPVAEPFTTAGGLKGLKISQRLTRTDLKTGEAKDSTYTPIYVFNISKAASADGPTRYEGIFVFPALSAFLSGTDTTALLGQVVDSLTSDRLTTVGQ